MSTPIISAPKPKQKSYASLLEHTLKFLPSGTQKAIEDDRPRVLLKKVSKVSIVTFKLSHDQNDVT